MSVSLPARPFEDVDHGSLRTHGLTSNERVLTLLVFSYWVVYENLIFFYPAEVGGTALVLLTSAVKLVLPFVFLGVTGLPSARALTRGPIALYLAVFATFLAWGLVPTLLGGNPLSWMKLLPRLAFLLSIIAFFSRRPAAFSLFAKCVIIYVLSALAQYWLVYATGSYGDSASATYAVLAGPHGILGNVTSTMFFPGAPFPFVRLCGLWNEPSNASASAFASFFFARYLVAIGEDKRWRWASVACLAAGILTLSNAGYFAFSCALLLGLLFSGSSWTTTRTVKVILLVPFAAGLLITVTIGRAYVATNLPDNVWARAITGARLSEDPDFYDPSNGRLDLLKQTAGVVQSSVIGVGIQDVGTGGIESSATAPVYWLLLTGIPGLLLILTREGVLLASARSLVSRHPEYLSVAQALIVVVAQQSVYGSWMNPNYFIPAAVLLVLSSNVSRQAAPLQMPVLRNAH